MNNSILLDATIKRTYDIRYTFSGQPVLEMILEHESEQEESGGVRKVKLNIPAKVIGDSALTFHNKLKCTVRISGFLMNSKSDYKSIILHINEISELNS